MNSMLRELGVGFDPEDLPIIEGEVVYTLRECLNLLDDEFLEMQYESICESEGKSTKKVSKKKMVDYLCKELPDTFRQMVSMYDSDEFDEYIKAKSTDDYDLVLFAMGFMYGFKNNKKIVYVVPNEFKDVYNEVHIFNGEDAKDKFRQYFMVYMLTNGAIKESMIEDIIMDSHIDIDKSIAEEEIEKMGMVLRSGYYIQKAEGLSIEEQKKAEDRFDKLIEKKEMLSYFHFNFSELIAYCVFVDHFLQELKDFFKSDSNEYNSVFATLVYSFKEFDSTVDKIIEKYHIKGKKRISDFKELIESYKLDIRFWDLNGRTVEEYEDEIIIQNMRLSEKPKDCSLKNCLKNLNEVGKQLLFEQYHVSQEEELEKAILEDFGEDIYDYDSFGYKELLESHGKDIESGVDAYNLKWGYLFLYQDGKSVKMVLPKEIKEILKSVDIHDLDDYSFLDEDMPF